jgi:transposase InsO family protein
VDNLTQDLYARTGRRGVPHIRARFLASLKGELIDLQAWPTRAMVRRAIVEYIAWYNGTRLHSTLGYKASAEFEEQDKIRKVVSKEACHGQDQL